MLSDFGCESTQLFAVLGKEAIQGVIQIRIVRLRLSASDAANSSTLGCFGE
jgi:hypothetical protein